MALFSAAIGGYMHVYTNILRGGVLSILGTLGFGIALFASKNESKNQNVRLAFLMAFAFCSGKLVTCPLTVSPCLRSTFKDCRPARCWTWHW